MREQSVIASALVVRLGIAQCVLWGVLYYAFAIILPPMSKELGVSPDAAVGAFSVALGVSALVAPHAGRWFDSGNAAVTLRWSPLAAAILLLAWASVQSLWTLYLTFAALGACMAVTLYEAAYGVVTAMTAEAGARSRAWAQITVLGGLASAVFLPLTQFLVAHSSWRMTLVMLAVLVAASGLLAPTALGKPLTSPLAAAHTVALMKSNMGDAWRWIVALMTLATAAATALSVNLYAHLVAHGAAPAIAAGVPALLGLMQLPGRIWLARRPPPNVPALLTACGVLQAAGLLGLALSTSGPVLMVAASLFGLGAGLLTLARPLALSAVADESRFNHVNGLSARFQSFARAAAPYGGATIMTLTGGFGVLAASLGVVIGISGVFAGRALIQTRK